MTPAPPHRRRRLPVHAAVVALCSPAAPRRRHDGVCRLARSGVCSGCRGGRQRAGGDALVPAVADPDHGASRSHPDATGVSSRRPVPRPRRRGRLPRRASRRPLPRPLGPRPRPPRSRASSAATRRRRRSTTRNGRPARLSAATSSVSGSLPMSVPEGPPRRSTTLPTWWPTSTPVRSSRPSHRTRGCAQRAR